MPDEMTVATVGLSELRAQIARIAKSLRPDLSEPVFYRGAQVLAEAARAKAPVGPHSKKLKRAFFGRAAPHLKDAIVVKTLQRSIWGNEPAPSIAAVDRRAAPHAWMVEHGTGERIGGDKSKRYKGRRFGKMPANPFMRRAFDEKKREVLEQIERELGELIDKAVRQ